MELYLNDKLGKITYEVEDTPISDSVLILAHGAGAGMYHPFMTSLSHHISALGVSVVRFNFPYMEKGKKAPGSPNDAIYAWKVMIDEVKKIFHGKDIFISGKSYGGRMASHLMAEFNTLGVKGIAYFGFPLHAPGRDSIDRATHLRHITIPQLFLQGTNDKLANLELLRPVLDELNLATLFEVEGADHSFKSPKSVGRGESETMELLASTTVNWMNGTMIN
ncbi:MAG: alpha/beta hydrolase [Ekhidna sp.]